MTDKEIAYELGMRLVKANFKLAAMMAELDMYRDREWNHIPWRSHVDEVIETLAHVSRERSEDLTHALDASDPKDLLRTLQTFLNENL
jgi:hypothetical protein